MSKKTLNIGLIGYGFMGRTHALGLLGRGAEELGTLSISLDAMLAMAKSANIDASLAFSHASELWFEGYEICAKDDLSEFFEKRIRRLHQRVGCLWSVVRSKMTVRRGGTTRSSSRSSSQTITTWVGPLFDANSESSSIAEFSSNHSNRQNVSAASRSKPLHSRNVTPTYCTKHAPQTCDNN